MDVTLAADLRRQNTEGPHWDLKSGSLLLVAIPEGEVFRLRPETGEIKTYGMGQKCGAVLTTGSDRLLVALADGLYFFDEASGALELASGIEHDIRGNRFNDAKCDYRGRLYAGTMDDTGSGGEGALYRVDPDMHVSRVVGGTKISNGMDFSPDGGSMYYIDSATRRIDVFDYDESSGEISSRRTFAVLPEGLGLPDGMTVDSSGGLWVAVWGGSCVINYSPEGRELGRIPVPAKYVSSCAFGGEDLGELYITTASRGKFDPEYPHAGGVFVTRPGARGRAPGIFGGC